MKTARECLLGLGRFSVVYRGELRGKSIAAKAFKAVLNAQQYPPCHDAQHQREVLEMLELEVDALVRCPLWGPFCVTLLFNCQGQIRPNRAK